MSAAVLTSLEEYLNTDYSPDREFVDGLVVERHVGELPHSFIQSNFVYVLRQRYPHLFVLPELRVRTVGGRHRIPDICVTLERPDTDVLQVAPFLAVEILSRRDEMSNLLEKLQEYSESGVSNIWVIDPRRKKVYQFTEYRLEEMRGTSVATNTPEIRIDFEEIFRSL
jgi:Uma2 family endonuclease